MEQKKRNILYGVAGVLVLAMLISYIQKSFELADTKAASASAIDSLRLANEEVEQMVAVLEMDKREMENEYEQFALQYDELKMQLNNDSLKTKLEQEQKRYQELLAELKRTNSRDAQEIKRLKEEISELRNILKDLVRQIDELSRENAALKTDNQNLRTSNAQQQQHITSLSTQKEELETKVAIASQLNATDIWAQGRTKKGKVAKSIKNVKSFVIGFNVARNVTTSTGIRSIYVRITTPTGDVLTKGGTVAYENRQIPYSIKKDIEYTGEEQAVTVYWEVAEALSAGTYRVDIIADSYNLGSTSFTFEK